MSLALQTSNPSAFFPSIIDQNAALSKNFKNVLITQIVHNIDVHMQEQITQNAAAHIVISG